MIADSRGNSGRSLAAGPNRRECGIFRFSSVAHWDLDERAVAAKFRFDGGNGVVLKTRDPDGQISDAGPVGGGMRYQPRDKNTNYYAYEYGINVIQKGTANRCMPDPKFYNN
jgi:hypothetical protein